MGAQGVDRLKCMVKKLPKIIIILGPTASGKTDLGIFLAKKFNGEIVSADSRQVYEEMNIGTAKPDQSEGQKVKGESDKGEYIVDGVAHHLIDVAGPDEEFTVGDFKKVAEEKIADMLNQGKLPIIVGGTGLYVWALVDNLEMPQKTVDTKLREKLNNTLLPELLKMLKEKDPDSCDYIDLKNPRRVIRALEVALFGESFWKKRQAGEPLYDVLQIGIKWSREELYKRINARANTQVRDGLVEEVKKLSFKYGWEVKAMNGIGYRQFRNYLEGKETLEQAVEKLKKDTRHYAKRQETWFKRDKRIVWVEKGDSKKTEDLVNKFLRHS